MAQPIRVLHVDDEPDFADLVAEWVERENDQIEVHTEQSVSDALDRLAEEQFDCIVSDFDMPEQNGIEFLRTVRENYPNLPFILFTGKGSEEVASEAISAGVTQYLQKETGTEQYTLLANQITNTVGRYRAEKELAEKDQILESILDNVPIVLYTLDEAGIFTRAQGNAFEEDEGDPSDAVGESVYEMFADSPKILNYYERALDGECVEEVTEVEESVFQSWFQPLRTDDDDITGVVGLSVDITERRERERELERKTAAMDSASIGIVLTGPVEGDNRIIYANDHFQRLTGYEEAEILGHNCRFLQGDETDSEQVARMRRAIEAEEPTTVELCNYRKDGSAFSNQVSITPIRMDGDEATHFVGFQRDVTERKQREQELERQNDLFEKAQDIAKVGAWEYDAKTDEVIWTDRLYQMLGVSSKFDPTPEDGIELYHPEDREEIRAAFEQSVANGDPWDIEVRLDTATDTPRWVRTRGDPYIENGEVVRVRGTIQEITERKVQAEELKRTNQRLEAFASVISHDLQKPLNVATGGLELAQAECESDHLETVAEGHEQMQALLDDLLTLARQGDTVSEPTPVELAEAVEGCWADIESAGTELSIDTEQVIEADPDILGQLLKNLLENAVQHGGKIVRVRELAEGFSVGDDGPGIPDDEREAVFERGYSTGTDGTGFGLSIVEQIAEAHGWEVTITESEDGGAEFEITDVRVVE